MVRVLALKEPGSGQVAHGTLQNLSQGTGIEPGGKGGEEREWRPT